MIALTRQGPQPAPGRAPLLPGLAPASPNQQSTIRNPKPEDGPAERAVRGGSDKPLSREQKTVLVLLAKEAYAKLSAVDPGLPDFDTWRVNEAVAACTRRIREARNSDFRAIRGRFRNHLGKAALAFDDALNEGSGDQAIALYKLAEACTQRALPLEYPAAICWRQFKCALKDASPKQIWNLVFTVRNRRKPAPRAGSEKGQVKSQKGRDYTLKVQKPETNTNQEDPF